jgi:mRNA-degrading endonuclease toxin of MazEF toxin-antitoxin module
MEEKKMGEFIVKKGMVFYLDEYGKKRPYLILSNDKCNATSSYVHAAPISVAEYDPKKWYCVPFKSTCGNTNVVNISNIRLVGKQHCNEESYTKAITMYTFNNKELFENISTAIKRQFDIDVEDSYSDYSIADNKIMEQPQMQMPSFNITINLNGVPMNASVESATVAEAESNKAEIVEEVKVEPETIHPERKIAKAVSEIDVTKNTEQKESCESIVNEKLIKSQNFSKERREYIINFIIKNHKMFGGKMSVKEIAEELNTTYPTVKRYADYVMQQKISSTNRVTLPESLDEELVKDYEKYGTKYVIKKYAQYGFSKRQQVYDAVRRRKALIEKKKVKV